MKPSFFEILKTFMALGVISFGPGMFALIHQRVVEQKKWMTESDFKETVTFSELAPGPFTVHLVMYIGYHLRGLAGLIWATFFFALPSLILVLIIAISYDNIMAHVPGLNYFMIGVWAAIIASMLSTILRISQDLWRDPILILLALISLSLIIVFRVNFIWLILLCGGFYMLGFWFWGFRSKVK